MRYTDLILFLLFIAVGSCKERSQSSHILEESTGLNEESAYFADFKRTVGYCVSRSPTFGVTEEQFDVMLKETLATWKNYLTERTYLQNWLGNNMVLRINSFTYEKRPCGTADLLFVLGGLDRSEARNMACGHGAPGATYRIENKIAERWARAMIWLSNDRTLKRDLQADCAESSFIETPENFPDWKAENNLNLRAVLTHELGHVLGFRHMDGTIMSETISRLMLDPVANKLELSHIDWQRVLLSLENRETFSKELSTETEEARAAFFRKVVGQEPGGKVTSRLKIKDSDISIALISGGQEFWLPLKLVGQEQDGPNIFAFRFRIEEVGVVWPALANVPWGEDEPREGLILGLSLQPQKKYKIRIEGTDAVITVSINPPGVETPYYIYYEDPDTFDEIPLFIAKTLREQFQ
ncbi:MAG: matrixin family metalloprotease [Oligoflexales bacterium]